MKLFISEKFSHSDETNNIFRIAGKGLIIWIKLAFAFELITGLCVASDMNELVSQVVFRVNTEKLYKFTFKCKNWQKN